MNLIRKLLIVLTILIPFLTYAQSAISETDTVFNQVDENGLKQGYWINYYENGNKRFEGLFKDDQPIETFTRYYSGQGVQSILEFNEDGKTAYAKIYYNNGKLASEGKYVDKQKDEEWKYYSYYDLSLCYSENYQMGKKHGASTIYFANGNVSEVLDFKLDVKDGLWAQYFENGKIYLKSTFKEGKQHGDYVQYHPNGMLHIQGKHVDDRSHGEWIFYDEKGEQLEKLDFVMGVASNQDELNARQEELLKQLEKNKGKFREPRISDIQF
jgi:antitoxin component YwqK of YwqJK toxin-antitoxin module